MGWIMDVVGLIGDVVGFLFHLTAFWRTLLSLGVGTGLVLLACHFAGANAWDSGIAIGGAVASLVFGIIWEFRARR